MKNTQYPALPVAQPRWPDGTHPQTSQHRSFWQSTPQRLAAGTAASVTALLFGAGIATAGLVFEVQPSNYNAGTKHWDLTPGGSLAPDYFQSADWGNPTKTLIGNPGSSVAYSAVDCTTSGQGFAGPLCPASLGGNGPRTIEAWVYTPTASNGGVIFDPSRQYVEDQSPNPNVNYGNFGFSNFDWNAIQCRGTGGDGSAHMNWGGTHDDRFGKWAHLVASYNGTVLDLYVNGVSAGSKTFAYNTVSGNSMTIGIMRGYFNASDVTTPHSFNEWDGWNIYHGYLGAIRVYDEAKSSSDIASEFAEGINFGEPGTVQQKITASAGPGGTISPSGDIYCAAGATLSFTVTPNQYYDVSSVLTSTVGEVLAGPTSQTYPMVNVAPADTITASFSEWTPTEITGTITDGTTGLAGVTVTATGNRGPFTAKTGAGGTYSIRVRPGDPYTVTAIRASYTMDVASLLAGPGAGLTGKNFTATYVQLPPQGMFPDVAFSGAYGTGDTWNLGTKFTTGPDPVFITALGTWDFNRDGLKNSHPVGIFDESGNSIVTVTVPTGSAAELIGDWRYVSCGVVTLAPNTTYTLAGNTFGDEWMEADHRGFASPYFDGFTSLGAFATGNVALVCPGPGTGGFQWHGSPDMSFNVNMIGSTISPYPKRTVSGTISNAGGLVDGASVSLKNGAAVVAGPVTTGPDGSYTLSSSGFADDATCTVSASKLGDLPGTLSVTISPGVMNYPNSNLTLTTDTSYDPTLIFSMTVDGLAGLSNGALTGDRATVYPSGGTMMAQGTPTVIAVDGVNWEQNQNPNNGANDCYLVKIPADAPTGDWSAPIAASGASIVAVVQPVYTGSLSGEHRGEVVDMFYNELYLAVAHGNSQGVAEGSVEICTRNYNTHNTGYVIPNGQKTILSLVVQQNGALALYANASQVWTGTSGTDYSTLIPISWEKQIRVGGGVDGWSIFNGNIGDVYLYKSAISNSNRTALEQSLAAKFGISLSASVTDYNTWATTKYPGSNLADSAADLDGDGMSNFQEYAFGLNPTSSSSVNPITVPFNKGSGTFSYTRTTNTGLTYKVWHSTDLVNWYSTGITEGVATDNGGVETVPVTLDPSLLTELKLFVRVTAE